MNSIRLEGFDDKEAAMIQETLAALASVGYDVSNIKELIWTEMPRKYRAMTLEDGAALSERAFTSQAMLNHVLEEELLHLQQKLLGQAIEFGAGTVRALEEEVDENRRFASPSPNDSGTPGATPS